MSLNAAPPPDCARISIRFYSAVQLICPGRRPNETCAFQLRKLKAIFADRTYLARTLRRRPNDQLRLHELNNLAARHKVRAVVTNDILFHEPGRRQLQDVVTCIRHRTTIDQAGYLRERHADRYLKPPEEMHRLFSRYPEALAATIEIVNRCRFDMSELTYQYPEEAIVPGLTAQQSLERFTWEGVADRYPDGVPDAGSPRQKGPSVARQPITSESRSYNIPRLLHEPTYWEMGWAMKIADGGRFSSIGRPAPDATTTHM